MDEYRARPVAQGSAFVPGKLEALHVVEATTAGVGRHVLDLCVHMRQAGLGVTVACPQVREHAQGDIAFVDRLRAAGITVVDVPMRYGVHLLADFRDYGRLVRLMQCRDFDVVHAHSSKAGVLGRLAARRCHVPAIVYTPNAFAFLGARDRFRRWFYRSVEQWLGQAMTDMLICVSRSEMALARQWAIVPAGHSVTVENAIDASQYAPASSLVEAKLALGLDPDRLVVGYVGRLAAQKGLQVLVQAAHRVLASDKGVHFLLVGEGNLERATRQMVQSLGLADRFWFPGYRTDIPRVLAALDVFVLPSLYEGMSYTLLEAMAAGRAIVATDVVGNCDLVRHGETGLLVPPHQARALADAITTLISLPEERQRLGAAASRAAAARSSPDQMARQVMEVYAGILEKKRTER